MFHPLSIRVRVLSMLLMGMADLLDEQFDVAAREFQGAIATDGWPDGAGKEIAYLLLGNTYIRQASQLSSQQLSTALAEKALAAFDKALSMQPNSVRALVGRAGTQYFLSINPGDDAEGASVDAGLLDRAEREFVSALSYPGPVQTNVQIKVMFGLAQVYIARRRCDIRG